MRKGRLLWLSLRKASPDFLSDQIKPLALLSSDDSTMARFVTAQRAATMFFGLWLAQFSPRDSAKKCVEMRP